jgi:hypothetical protein
MRDDFTPISSRQEAGDDAQSAPSDGDDGHIADGGAEHAKEVLLHVIGMKLSTLRANQLLINRFGTATIFYSHMLFLIFSI